jgi:hypothetical protein
VSALDDARADLTAVCQALSLARAKVDELAKVALAEGHASRIGTVMKARRRIDKAQDAVREAYQTFGVRPI